MDVNLSNLPDGWARTTLGEIIEPLKEKINLPKIKENSYISLGHLKKIQEVLVEWIYPRKEVGSNAKT